MPEPESQEYKPKFIRSGTVVKKGGSLQITIPSEYVQKYNLKVHDRVLIFEYGKGMLLLAPLMEDQISRIVLKQYLEPSSQ